jgi:hypothetical protein
MVSFDIQCCKEPTGPLGVIEWINSISVQPTLTKLPISVERWKKPIRYDVVENETLDSEMGMES